jgi:outer membrane protein OmpA-like peptidoglycan-associated protein
VSGLFLKIKINGNIRCALLAGSMMLPILAVPQAGTAADTSSVQASAAAIILAQAVPQGQAIDPATGKPLPKGVPPKGNQPPPKGPAAVPPGAQPPAAATPPQPAQKFGVQPKGNQPLQGSVTPPTAAPVPPPAAAVPPSPGAQPRQFGVQPKGNQPLQGNIAPATPAPATAATPPNPQQRNVVPGAKPLPTPGGAPAAAAVPPTQPLQQNVVPGAKPLPVPGAATPAPATAAVPGAKPLPVPGAAAPAAVPSQAPIKTIGAPVAPAAIVTGNVHQLQTQRQERREAGGRVVIEEPGRLIVREGNTTIIRHDETARFSVWGAPRVEVRGSEHFAYISRPGYDIINVTGPDGRLLRRIRRGPDGREVIIIDNSRGPGFAAGLAVGAAGGLILGLAAPVITIPRERYIVDISAAPAPLLYETLEAPPLVEIERPYSLDEIRYNVALRDRMRRIDVDSVTFDTGSWEVMPEQQPKLQVVADAMQRILARHPDEVFMIEGHTDAVGNDVDNLSLSDHRAESVAVILTNAFQIPPENLVTQGYGAQHLKIPTDGPSRENRRVTVRRITPLLQGKMARL